MSLHDITVKSGASSWTPTGGSDVNFTDAPVTVTGMVQVANYANATYREREYITFFGKEPSANNGIFGKAVRKATVYVPRDYDEVYVKNLLRIEAQIHPAMTDLDKALLLDTGAQLLLSAAREYYLKGTTA